jgi:hypothetical protein
MGPQDPKDVTRDVARDLSSVVGELASLKGDATKNMNDDGQLLQLRQDTPNTYNTYTREDRQQHVGSPGRINRPKAIREETQPHTI